MTDRPTSRRLFQRCLLALAALAAAGAVPAQEGYPDRPIRFIVPQPPGGTGDVVSRIVAQRLAARLGKPVVVENKAGAGGTLGASMAAKAPADGYTLVLSSPGFSTFASMYPKLSFNPATELTAVGMMGSVPIALLTRNEAAFKTLPELLAFAKAHPGKISYASAGQGSLSHLMGAWFAAESKANVTHIPYSGTAPALQALVGGHVDIYFDPMAGAELVKTGKLRAIATTTDKRIAAMPTVPTMAELGTPIRGSVWLGVMTTGGTPQPIVERLSRELQAVMQEPEVRQQLETRGVIADPMSAAELTRFMASETQTWSKLVRDNHIRAE